MESIVLKNTVFLKRHCIYSSEDIVVENTTTGQEGGDPFIRIQAEGPCLSTHLVNILRAFTFDRIKETSHVALDVDLHNGHVRGLCLYTQEEIHFLQNLCPHGFSIKDSTINPKQIAQLSFFSI